MEYVLNYAANVWQVLQELAPWLLLGSLIAGLLHVIIPPGFIRNHLGSGGLRNIVKAALLGVPMPLCSCGVIPATIGLKKEGASDGASVSFLISTPQTGVDSITVSAVFLGIPFACFKVVSAFVTGIIGGMLVGVGREPDVAPPAQTAPAAESDHSHGSGSLLTRIGGALDFALLDLLYGIWKWIVVGVLISAAITTFIPQGALADNALTSGLAGMLLMLLISMPLYVCATASVPIAASLVLAGMPTGAALVFLMAGPATNVATLGAVAKEFGRRVTAIYIGVIAVMSVLFGWLFDILMGGYFRPVAGEAAEHGGWLGLIGALLLLVLFAYFMFRDIRFFLWEHRQEEMVGEERLVLQVSDMTCEGCARNVKLAIGAQDGVAAVDVDLESGNVTVHGHGFHPERVEEAVSEAGYTPHMVTEKTRDETG